MTENVTAVSEKRQVDVKDALPKAKNKRRKTFPPKNCPFDGFEDDSDFEDC